MLVLAVSIGSVEATHHASQDASGLVKSRLFIQLAVVRVVRVVSGDGESGEWWW